MFDKAAKKSGKTGDNLLIMLETRLDNAVFRLGFAASRKEARQLVTHGHFTINGKKVNIPSYQVKPGMVIELKEASRKIERFRQNVEANQSVVVPKWLEFDAANLCGKFLNVPAREEIPESINEQLIVDLYSK